MRAIRGGARARPRPRPRLERDRPRLTGRAAGLLVAVSVLVVMAIVPARQYLEQRGRIAELDRQAAELETQNSELRREVSFLFVDDAGEALQHALVPSPADLPQAVR